MIWNAAISQFVKQKHLFLIHMLVLDSKRWVLRILKHCFFEAFRASVYYVRRNTIFIGLGQYVNKHVSISDKNWRKSMAFPS